MPYRLNAGEYDAVLALDSAARCMHFIARITDWEQLWSVRSADGWLVGTTPGGLTYFPVWPHPDYADRTTAAHFPGHTPGEISLVCFMDDWLTRLDADDTKLAVFPDREWAFHVVEPSELQREITIEAARYE